MISHLDSFGPLGRQNARGLRWIDDNIRFTVVGPGALWSLAFGDGDSNSDPSGVPAPANALFFSAGPLQNNVFHGLFGTLTPISADLTQGSDQ